MERNYNLGDIVDFLVDNNYDTASLVFEKYPKLLHNPIRLYEKDGVQINLENSDKNIYISGIDKRDFLIIASKKQISDKLYLPIYVFEDNRRMQELGNLSKKYIDGQYVPALNIRQELFSFSPEKNELKEWKIVEIIFLMKEHYANGTSKFETTDWKVQYKIKNKKDETDVRTIEHFSVKNDNNLIYGCGVYKKKWSDECYFTTKEKLHGIYFDWLTAPDTNPNMEYKPDPEWDNMSPIEQDTFGTNEVW